MTSIRVQSTGLLYRNQKPHLRSRQASFPSVVRLPDGALLASFGVGSAFESIDAHTQLARSTDNGETWELEAALLDTPTTPPTSSNLRLTALSGGEVIASGARWDRSQTDEGLVNPLTLGFVPTELVLLRSTDGGRTWGSPQVVTPPLVGPSFEICSPIVPLVDGRWLWPTSTWRGWDGDAPNGMKAVALVTHDAGHSWPEYVDVMDGTREGIVYWEQKLVTLSDGRMLAVCWAHDLDAGTDLPVHAAVSTDAGRSFAPPRPLPLTGQTTTSLALPDGRLLCVYRRTDLPGLWAALLREDGDTWAQEAEALLWGASGASSRATANTIAEEMSALRFGLPCLLPLPDGALHLTFWCVEDCVAVIRWMTLRVE